MNYLWDTPIQDIKTRAYHNTEGYLLPPTGITATPVYLNDGFSTVREGMQLLGIDYYRNGNILSSFADHYYVDNNNLSNFVDNNTLYNSTRILAYDNWNRLRRLTYLAVGPFYMWDYTGEGTISGNWRDFHTFNIQDFDGDTAFYLDDSSAGSHSNIPAYVVQPCTSCVVGGYISGGILYGGIMAEVKDVEYQADVVYVSIDRPVNTSASSVIFIVENSKYHYPVLPLELKNSEILNPARCQWDVDTYSTLFDGYKDSYPSAYVSAGIGSKRYCSRMDNENTDLSKYNLNGARCNNTTCPNYSAYKPGYMTSEFISGFYLSKGTYQHQLQAGVPDNSNFRIGRDGVEGLLTLCGIGNIGCFESECGLWMGYKQYLLQGGGVIKYRYGNDTVTGFDIFRSFNDQQGYLALQDITQTDNTGILSEVKSKQVTKDDPLSGGSLQPRDGKTPGYDYSVGLGLNRIQSIGTKNNNISPSGDGLSGKQNVKPKKYTSAIFNQTAGVYSNPNGETRLTVLSSPQTIDGFQYNIIWEVPQYADKVTSPRAKKTKPSAGIHHITVSDNNDFDLEFELGSLDLQFSDIIANPHQADPTYQTVSIGGNVVKGNMGWEIYNPGSNRKIGDPQEYVFPGDRITFHGGSLDGISLICSGAKAYGGSKDTSALGLLPQISGLPYYLTHDEKFKCRDVGTFQFDPNFRCNEFNALFTNYTSGSTCSIDQGAVIPPNSTITLKQVQGNTSTNITDYKLDRVSGKFYINGSSFTGNCKLHCALRVYDTRKVEPVENIRAESIFLDTVIDNGWINYGLNTSIFKAQFEIWSAKPGTAGAVQIDWGLRQKTTAINWNNFSWDHADMELTIPAGQPAIGWSGWVISGYDPTIPIGFSYGPWFSSITLDIPENEQDYIDNYTGTRDSPLNCGFSASLPVLKISSSLELTRLIGEDVAEAKLDFTLSDAEIKKLNNVTCRPWNPGYPGEVLSSTNLNLVLLSANASEMDLANMEELATIGCPVKRVQDGEHWKYQGTLDFTEHLKIVLDSLTGNKVLYIMPSSTKTEELTLGSLVDITNESITTFGTGYWGEDPNNLWWEIIEMDMTGISAGGLHVRLNQSAVSGGAKFIHDGNSQNFLPDLTYEPET